MVKKFVRLALACEYQRRPIRRADISEKVLGSQGRQFKKVFEQAQQELRSVFGMEMVELPAREKVTLQQRRGECRCSSDWDVATRLTDIEQRPQRTTKQIKALLPGC